jgi:hypothetical protein
MTGTQLIGGTLDMQALARLHFTTLSQAEQTTTIRRVAVSQGLLTIAAATGLSVRADRANPQRRRPEDERVMNYVGMARTRRNPSLTAPLKVELRCRAIAPTRGVIQAEVVADAASRFEKRALIAGAGLLPAGNFAHAKGRQLLIPTQIADR